MGCLQPLLIHADGSATCGGELCPDGTDLAAAVRDHEVVLNCRVLSERTCTLCFPLGLPSGLPTCLGKAVVHADLSMECSFPRCREQPGPGLWLANHCEIRSCNRRPELCDLCGDADAKGTT
jgi:hypothetical protein